ncbi:WXG100 family type VII secretion target [Nocardia gipuzkoensis]|uniref:WXG100 family type VII secretion target n=1 Tax=Nocardia gipuzkoensis TaxID=2749991 RepID=UPI001E3416AF|nr:WXG100 family type VII secretion target [Nocardia gipuzkoensis]UGT67003.1 WXG100 family type VII secretion target [Nocardia gipuzkoensis]
MEYKVNLGQLDATTVRIDALRGFLEQSLIEIDERIVTVQQTWNGAAADAYAEAHADWVAGAQKAACGIEKMRAAAQAAHDAYSATVAANLSVLGRGGSPGHQGGPAR